MVTSPGGEGVLIFMQEDIYELHGQYKKWVKLKYKSTIASYATGINAIPVPDEFSLDDVFGDNSDDEDLYYPGSGYDVWYLEDTLAHDTELELVQNEETEAVDNEIDVIEVTEKVVPSPTSATSTSSASSAITSTTQNEILTTHKPSHKDHELRSGIPRITTSLKMISICIIFNLV